MRSPIPNMPIPVRIPLTSDDEDSEGQPPAISPHRSSRAKKGYDIKRLLEQAEGLRAEGDVWALVEMGWWNDWWEYVGRGDAMEVDGEEDDDRGFRPVNNKKLLVVRKGEKAWRLKPDLVEGVDFRAVPIDAWRALMSWYGGGPPILRHLVMLGPEHEEADGEEQKEGTAIRTLELELYPTETSRAVQVRPPCDMTWK